LKKTTGKGGYWSQRGGSLLYKQLGLNSVVSNILQEPNNKEPGKTNWGKNVIKADAKIFSSAAQNHERLNGKSSPQEEETIIKPRLGQSWEKEKEIHQIQRRQKQGTGSVGNTNLQYPLFVACQKKRRWNKCIKA